MKPPSNPNAISKLFNGSQGPGSALFGQPDPSQPTPQPMAAASPQPAALSPSPNPAAPTPTPSPSPVQPGTLSAAMKPLLSEQDFAAANPDATKAYMPTRPVGDFDKIPEGQPGADAWANRHNELRRGLASLFAGLAEFGRPGSGQALEGRWLNQAAEQRAYDDPANQAKMKAGALNQAYSKYLTEGGQQAQIEHEQAETQNLHANVPLLQHQQQFLDKVRTLKESGKYGSDEELFNSVLPEAATIPGLTRQMIVDQINNAKPLGAQFNVQTDKQGRPEFVQDRAGQKYYPDANGKFSDPEMQKQWDSEMQSHQKGISEEEDKEKRVAGYAAERQTQSFTNSQQMEATKKVQPRIDTALDANERLARMESSYEKAKNGDQQAMLALLADHIGMTFGLQKNVKANKALIQEAQESQPWLAKIQAKFDKNGYLSGATLGPEQMKQMLDLGYRARDQAFASAHEAATSYGQPLPKGFTDVEAQRPAGSRPALQEQGGGAQHVPGGKAQGLKEGATGTGSDGKKYVVKGGVWVKQ